METLARQRGVCPARSLLVITKGHVQRPSVLSFSCLPQSLLQAGASLPAPAATTAFIKALPPNQTPFVRGTAARSSSAGAGAPMSPSKQTLSHFPSPVPHGFTHARVHAGAWACCPQCRMGVTEPCFQSCIPAPNPLSTLGLVCGRRSRSQHLGWPITPPTLGVAGRCWYSGGVCTAVRASRMDLLSLPTIPIPQQQPISSLPPGTQSCWRQRQQHPPTPSTQGLMLIKCSPGADN